MTLLERTLEIVGGDTFGAIYRDIRLAVAYIAMDEADARLIMGLMDAHAQSQGFGNAEEMAAYYTGAIDDEATSPAA